MDEGYDVIDRYEEVFSRFAVVTCDNGPPSGSFEVKQYLANRNIKLLYSPSYTPSANSPLERGVQIIKKTLIRSVIVNTIQNRKISLKKCFNQCLRSYRFTSKTVTGKTPAVLNCRILKFQNKIEGFSKVRCISVNEKELVKSPIKGEKKWLFGRIVM